MMRKLLFLTIAFVGLWACQDDDESGFDVPVEFRKALEFQPIAGGATMKYYLPSNKDIYGVKVRYADEYGYAMEKTGTYLDDTLLLTGFNAPQTSVPAQVCFFNERMEETDAIDVAFDTEASAPWAFFDCVSVMPFWNGFSVRYTSPDVVSGLVHVFYLGTNPRTGEPDSILMLTSPIMEGGDTLNIQMQQRQEATTVIVRTEDFRGNRVKQEIFPDLAALYIDTLKSSDFDYHFTGTEVESDEYLIGEQYLYDGDKNGQQLKANALNGNRFGLCTYVTGPNSFGERYIIDLREPRVPATVRIYANVKLETSYPDAGSGYSLMETLFGGWYCSRLPSKLRLYGTNEDPETVELEDCAVLFSLNDEPELSYWKQSWAARCDAIYSSTSFISYKEASPEVVAEAEPVYLDMLCNYEEVDDGQGGVTGQSYRYLFFVIEDTYYGSTGNYGYEVNEGEYITFSELEVCVQAK